MCVRCWDCGAWWLLEGWWRTSVDRWSEPGCWWCARPMGWRWWLLFGVPVRGVGCVGVVGAAVAVPSDGVEAGAAVFLSGEAVAAPVLPAGSFVAGWSEMALVWWVT